MNDLPNPAQLRTMARPQPDAPLAELRRLIADDAYAMTFQTFGQYRTALLKAADKIAAGECNPPGRAEGVDVGGKKEEQRG
jgi:hypothetical protein